MDPKRLNYLKAGLHGLGTADEKLSRFCDHLGCREVGAYPAPKNRLALRDYYYFCLEHVQAYNRDWNFYADMDVAQIEEDRRQDFIWNRKTWPFATQAQSYSPKPYKSKDHQTGAYPRVERPTQPGFGPSESNLRDPLNLFGQGFFETGQAKQQNPFGQDQDQVYSTEAYLTPEQEQACKLFGLEFPFHPELARERYKELAKRFHPDFHNGDATKEEALKKINAAYEVLKDFFEKNLQGA